MIRPEGERHEGRGEAGGIKIYETPRVLLVGSWGSEALVSAFQDFL
jgi:hypothetical protein